MNWSALSGGLFGAGLQMASQAISYNYQKKLMALQQSYNVENWNRQNEYDLPTNQRSRLLDAGINPLFTDGSQMSSAIAPVSQATPPPGDLSRGVDAYANIMNAESNKRMALADEDYKRSLTATEDALRDSKVTISNVEAKFAEPLSKAELKKAAVEIEKFKSDIDSSAEQIKQGWAALSIEDRKQAQAEIMAEFERMCVERRWNYDQKLYAQQIIQNSLNFDLTRAQTNAANAAANASNASAALSYSQAEGQDIQNNLDSTFGYTDRRNAQVLDKQLFETNKANAHIYNLRNLSEWNSVSDGIKSIFLYGSSILGGVGAAGINAVTRPKIVYR